MIDISWFQCTKCEGSVHRTSDGLECSNCGINIPEAGHIPVFEQNYLTDFINQEREYWESDEVSGSEEGFHAFTENSYTKSVDLLALPEKGIGLDFACGSGTFGQHLKDHTIVGLDISLSLLESSKGIIPVQGSGMQLPFRSELFDFAICAAALHHMPDPELALKEVIRVLKPDGILGILELNLSHPQRKLIADSRSPVRKLFPTSKYSPSEQLIREKDLKRWISKYGCEICDIHYISPEYRTPSPFGKIQSWIAQNLAKGWLVKYLHSYLIISARKEGTR